MNRITTRARSLHTLRVIGTSRLLALLATYALGALACGAPADGTSAMNGSGHAGVLEPVGGAAAHSGDSPAATWCAAREVLEHKCQRCHGATPEHGAPFSLVSYEDTQVVNARGKARYELMAEAISSDYMPAMFVKLSPAVEPLTDEERATLLDWCEHEAPAPSADDEACPDP